MVPGADGAYTYYEDEGDTEGYKKGLCTTTLLRHQNNTLTICARKGSFPGMPENRAYTVEFLAVDRPNTVTVNGQTLSNGTWNYNNLTRKVTVFVGQTPCNSEINVKLVY